MLTIELGEQGMEFVPDIHLIPKEHMVGELLPVP